MSAHPFKVGAVFSSLASKNCCGTQISRAVLAIFALAKWAIQSHLDKIVITDIIQSSQQSAGFR